VDNTSIGVEPAKAPADEQGLEENERDEESSRSKHTRAHSYATRMTISFALIAAMTALVAVGVLSFVWEQHFQTYTYENMRSVAESTAEQIAAQYARDGAFSDAALQRARYAVTTTRGIGMQVVDTAGDVVFDSSTMLAQAEDLNVPSLAPPQSSNNMARAAIIVNDQAVGSVRVWVYGSNQLLRAQDEDFRSRSYQAVVAAALIAIALASLIGFVFARNLVRPISRISKTAIELKEGDLSARTGMSGDDEISQLGETFDEMATAIERDRKLERRLTTDVAHELRTPLMAIQATVEAMVDGVYPTDEEHLEIVNSEVQRLSRLVGSLMKLSRLENRANPNKEDVVDVGEVVSAIVSTHEAYVNESGLSLNYKADPEVLVYGDADLIRQATANLISNAVRYTPEGGHIDVRVRKGESMAQIAVRDTGIGLTPEEARMVFQRFWRAGSARDRESGGLGVGLTVVKEIVDRHDGWVQVEGRKGEGACFTIHIPLCSTTDQRRKAEAKSKGQKKASGNTGRLR